MVGKEKVLEKRLDDVRTFVNALKIALIIQIPIAFLTILTTVFKVEYLITFIIVVASLLSLLIREVKIREKLYTEWGRDPMSGKDDIIDATILAVIAIAVLIIGWIL